MLVTAILVTAVSGRGGDLGTCRHRPYPDLLHPHGRAPHRRLLNPARTLGPGLFTSTLNVFWIYLVGTFLGAALAGGLYRGLLKGEET